MSSQQPMRDPVPYAPFLWFFLFLFFLRVVGQVIVVLFRPRWLPAMPQWYSGLIPYPVLLPIQIMILILMGTMARDFSRGSGFFVTPNPPLGTGIVGFSFLYFSSMIVRYLLRMKRRPEQRWLGGAIPIIFHCVLAAFLFVFGRYHLP